VGVISAEALKLLGDGVGDDLAADLFGERLETDSVRRVDIQCPPSTALVARKWQLTSLNQALGSHHDNNADNDEPESERDTKRLVYCYERGHEPVIFGNGIFCPDNLNDW